MLRERRHERRFSAGCVSRAQGSLMVVFSASKWNGDVFLFFVFLARSSGVDGQVGLFSSLGSRATLIDISPPISRGSSGSQFAAHGRPGHVRGTCLVDDGGRLSPSNRSAGWLLRSLFVAWRACALFPDEPSSGCGPGWKHRGSTLPRPSTCIRAGCGLASNTGILRGWRIGMEVVGGVGCGAGALH